MIYCQLPYGIFWILCLQICTASPINYRDRPDVFVEMFVNCVQNENCSFYFWHLSKTGGTTLGYNFKQLFPNNAPNNCCNGRAVHHFKENVEKYCLSKFSSHEVNGEQMRMIIETCTKLQPSSSAIVMFTFRDPISRFVSWINHLCNRLLIRRSAELQRFCHRCEYAPDTEKEMKELIGRYNDLYLSASSIMGMNVNDVQVLSLDTMDMNNFLETPSLGEGFKISRMRENAGKSDICNFAITSEIIKELSISAEVYRNLTLGEF